MSNLIDDVVDDIRVQITEYGDCTVLEELLSFVPTKILIQALGENRWHKYKSIKESK